MAYNKIKNNLFFDGNVPYVSDLVNSLSPQKFYVRKSNRSISGKVAMIGFSSFKVAKALAIKIGELLPVQCWSVVIRPHIESDGNKYFYLSVPIRNHSWRPVVCKA